MDDPITIINSIIDIMQKIEQTLGIDLLLLAFVFIIAQTLKSLLLKNIKDKKIKTRFIILILFITGLLGSVFKIFTGKMPIEEWISKSTIIYVVAPLGIYSIITKAFPNSRMAKWLSSNGEDKKKK